MPIDRKAEATTRQFRIIFPADLNDNGILFGGNALKWMDEVAYITAQRFTRMKMVTISCDQISFKKAVKQGMMTELIGNVIMARNTKISVKVQMYIEHLESGERETALEAVFTFAAVDKDYKPVAVNWSNFLQS